MNLTLLFRLFPIRRAMVGVLSITSVRTPDFVRSRRSQRSTLDTAGRLSDPGCIFCSRTDEKINSIVAQNDTCYARLDNFPVTPGHIEVVPKRHVESFFDLEQTEVADAFALMAVVRESLSREFRPDGYTIGVNEGKAAGRTVDHLHIHLIPRRFGDVEDPRGGIRHVVPSFHPDLWSGHQAVQVSDAEPRLLPAGAERART